MTHLTPRHWVPAACEAHVQGLATKAAQPSARVADRIDALIPTMPFCLLLWMALTR